jgi:hypothetical protein
MFSRNFFSKALMYKKYRLRNTDIATVNIISIPDSRLPIMLIINIISIMDSRIPMLLLVAISVMATPKYCFKG